MALQVFFSSVAKRDIARLPHKDISAFELIFKKIIKYFTNKNFSDIHISKLSGYESLYRFRSGPIRIIFRKEDDKIIILVIAKRKEAYRLLKQRT